MSVNRKDKCVTGIFSNKLVATYSCVLATILLSHIGMSVSSSSHMDEFAYKQWKQNSLGKSLKPRYNPEKQVAVSPKVTKYHAANFLTSKQTRTKKADYSPEGSQGRGRKMERLVAVARQGGGGGGGGGWGWGWPAPPHHGGGSGARRSYEGPSFNLPPVSLGLDSEKLPEVMVKIGDWIANSAWFENISSESRTAKQLGDKVGMRKWFEAFKKDPVEYQCVRKMACETLATSPLAEKSLRTSFGSVFLSVFSNFIEHGNELQDLVKQIVGNPKKCDDLVTGGYCEEN